MQTNIIRLILIITLLLPFHLLTAQDKKQDDISIIKSLRTASNVAIAKHDVDGIAKYWLDDFVQIRGNASSLTGKDTIAASWKEMFKTKPDVGYVRNTTEIIINANGIMAWETGN